MSLLEDTNVKVVVRCRCNLNIIVNLDLSLLCLQISITFIVLHFDLFMFRPLNTKEKAACERSCGI